MGFGKRIQSVVGGVRWFHVRVDKSYGVERCFDEMEPWRRILYVYVSWKERVGSVRIYRQENVVVDVQS
jgi:hypothetical protein